MVMEIDDKLIKDLHYAIKDSGSHPEYHRIIMSRHRSEWPVLWHTISSILMATNDRVQ